jgi:bifunctional non-homologous end joining protein LigD
VITHPEKVLFPEDGITKGDLAAYYTAIAPVMLPHLSGRPVTLERYPAGIGKKGFWQKDVEGFRLARARRGPQERWRRPSSIVTDLRSLLGSLIRTRSPSTWTSRAPDVDHPDICVFDLDPSRDDPAEVRAAAIGLRELLQELGLPSWVKTSGSKVSHRGASIGKPTWGSAVRERGRQALRETGARSADAGVQQGNRRGASIDTGRNGYSATLRPHTRAAKLAPVSAPCTGTKSRLGR